MIIECRGSYVLSLHVDTFYSLAFTTIMWLRMKLSLTLLHYGFKSYNFLLHVNAGETRSTLMLQRTRQPGPFNLILLCHRTKVRPAGMNEEAGAFCCLFIVVVSQEVFPQEVRATACPLPSRKGQADCERGQAWK